MAGHAGDGRDALNPSGTYSIYGTDFQLPATEPQTARFVPVFTTHVKLNRDILRAMDSKEFGTASAET